MRFPDYTKGCTPAPSRVFLKLITTPGTISEKLKVGLYRI